MSKEGEMNDRELDLLVARHVFQETVKQRTHDEMGVEGIIGNGLVVIHCAQCGKRWNRLQDIDILCSATPHATAYSTDGNHMLAVIEKMRELGWLGSITLKICGKHVEDEAMQFEAKFRHVEAPWKDSWAFDPSAPRAVAIAALLAHGVEV